MNMEVFKILSVFFASLFIIGIKCGPTNNYFVPCKIDDQECLINVLKTIKRLASIGVPEFELDPFDPMTIKDVTLGVPGVATVKIIEAILRGQSKCIYLSSVIDIAHGNGTIEFECSITMNGTYEAFVEKPILLGLPIRKTITGKGEFAIESINTNMLSEFTINIIKDAEGVIKIQYGEGDVLYDVNKEGHEVKINVSGLKSGEENVDAVINKLFNKNWKSLTSVFLPSFLKERLTMVLGPEFKIFFKLPASYFISDDLEPYVTKIYNR